MMNRKILIFTVCLLFVLGLSASSLGGVVCVGGNGEMRVEAACEPCCEEPEAACTEDQDDCEPDHHDHCGDCTDLPLIQEKLTRRPVGESYTDVESDLAPPAADQSVQIQVLETSEAPPTHDFPPLNRGPDLLASVVLIS